MVFINGFATIARFCVNFWLRVHRAAEDNFSIVRAVLIAISGRLGDEVVYIRGAAVRAITRSEYLIVPIFLIDKTHHRTYR